jgi:hypothetical protein
MPDKSSVELLYSEAGKEYHHTEYLIFVYLAAAAAAEVALLQTRPMVPSLVVAAMLELGAILVTARQIESRDYRMDMIKHAEKYLRISPLVGEEDPHVIRLGTTVLLLSIGLFIVPVLWLFSAFFRRPLRILVRNSEGDISGGVQW